MLQHLFELSDAVACPAGRIHQNGRWINRRVTAETCAAADTQKLVAAREDVRAGGCHGDDDQEDKRQPSTHRDLLLHCSVHVTPAPGQSQGYWSWSFMGFLWG